MLMAKLDDSLRSRQLLRPGSARGRHGSLCQCPSATCRTCALREPLSVGFRQRRSLLLECRPVNAFWVLASIYLSSMIVIVDDWAERPQALHLNPVHAGRRCSRLIAIQ